MGDEAEGIYTVHVTAQTLERQPVNELDEADRGVLFIPWPRPPRVGTKIEVNVLLGDGTEARLAALVVWSRPPRQGVVAGFRAQLAKPPADLMTRIRALVDGARQSAVARDVDARRSGIDGPVRERVRSRSDLTSGVSSTTGRISTAPSSPNTSTPSGTPVATNTGPIAVGNRTGPILINRGTTAPPAPFPVPPAPTAPYGSPQPAAPPTKSFFKPDLVEPIELPKADSRPMRLATGSAGNELVFDSHPASVTPSDTASSPPVPPRPATATLKFPAVQPPPPAVAQPAPGPPPSPSAATLWAAPSPQPAPPPAYPATSGVTLNPRVETVSSTIAVRLTFSSPKTYLLHFERFFEHGEVYVAQTPPPPAGAAVKITLEVPDGDAPLVAHAVVKRPVEPPEVPRAGWIASLVDLDGAIAERLTTASFIVSSPTSGIPRSDAD